MPFVAYFLLGKQRKQLEIARFQPTNVATKTIYLGFIQRVVQTILCYNKDTSADTQRHSARAEDFLTSDRRFRGYSSVEEEEEEGEKKEGPCDLTRTGSDISFSRPQATRALIRAGFFNSVRQNKCFQDPFGSTRKPNRLLSTAGVEATSGCYRSLQASFSNGFLAAATIVVG